MNELRNALEAEIPEYAGSLHELAKGPDYVAYAIDVPGEKATGAWKQLLRARGATKHYPVILGEDYSHPGLGHEQLPSAASLLKEAAAIGGAEWLRSKAEEYAASLAEFGEGDLGEDDGFFEMPESDEASGQNDFYSLKKGLSNDLRSTVSIALVPAEQGYQVPAYMLFGGWNECPGSAEQIAVLKYWHESHGAQVACMGNDVLELWLEKPLVDSEAALAVAKEQFAYCEDIVSQGTETVGALAAGLQYSSVWFFWWD